MDNEIQYRLTTTIIIIFKSFTSCVCTAVLEKTSRQLRQRKRNISNQFMCSTIIAAEVMMVVGLSQIVLL